MKWEYREEVEIFEKKTKAYYWQSNKGIKRGAGAQLGKAVNLVGRLLLLTQ